MNKSLSRIHAAVLKALPHHPDPQIMRCRQSSSLAEIANSAESLGHYYREAVAQRDELLAALEEVVRISDRKHDAWDRAHAAIAAIKVSAPIGSSKARLDWLESMHTLHCSISILYVVDGYRLELLHDSDETGAAIHGKTLEEAIDNAIAAGWKSSRHGEGVPRNPTQGGDL